MFLDHACDNGNFLTQNTLKNLYIKYTKKSKKRRLEKYLEYESAVEVNGFEAYMKRLASFFKEDVVSRAVRTCKNPAGSDLGAENGSLVGVQIQDHKNS